MSNTFELMSDFIQNKMRMSHIYQPVMIMELLKKEGMASAEDIAKALLSRDISQIEYYSHITKNMVGKVLRNHQLVERQKNKFTLIGYSDLTPMEVEKLFDLCVDKENEYVARRGNRIWTHRTKSAGYVSGTKRYEVLKRAKYRCELCGTPAEDKALEVDHILPRNRQGSDEISNLQALCYSCNASKRDRDDTDFRGTAESYEKRESNCPFCEVTGEQKLALNELAYCLADINPVAPHHSLIIPNRHVLDFFDLYQPEINAVHSLLKERRTEILEKDPDITAFNINVNNGTDAGQQVPHCHIHLIPRTRRS